MFSGGDDEFAGGLAGFHVGLGLLDLTPARRTS